MSCAAIAALSVVASIGAAAVSDTPNRSSASAKREGQAAVANQVAMLAADSQFASSYICVRVQPGMSAFQAADGSWTLRRAGAIGEGNPQEAALAQDELALNAIFATHHVTRIDRFMNGQFKRPDLAAKYGLDRSHIVHLGEGANAAALVAELNANFAQGGGGLVEFAQRDNVGSLAGIPNDPSFSLQWNMHNVGQTVQGAPGVADADIDAPEAWDIHTGSSATIIAVVDSGTQFDHPELSGKVLVGADTYGATLPPYPTDTTDLNGHGTHVSGIIAARANNSIGVCGVNHDAKILPIRVTSPTFTIFQQDVAEAVIFAADNGADAINMSLQFYAGVVIDLQNAVAYAYDAGALPIAATGNGAAAGTVAWPAKYPKCMAVGATNNSDGLYSLSNNGAEIDVTAPGQGVWSCWRLSGWQYNSGTSMASPHVAGLAGLISSRNPALSSVQIEAIIKNTSQDKGAAGWDSFFGWGRTNINAALIAAAPSCDGNTNADGAVNVTDLLAVIGAWGACVSPPMGCAGDVAPVGPPIGDGQVNVTDLLLVIGRWGPCP